MFFQKRKRAGEGKNEETHSVIEHADHVKITNVNVKVSVKNPAVFLLAIFIILKSFLKNQKPKLKKK